jgi:hypothetical protein
MNSGQFDHFTDQKRPIAFAAEFGYGYSTTRCEDDFTRAMDTLTTDFPTTKRRILCGEIDQSRTKIFEIAAKSDADRRATVEQWRESIRMACAVYRLSCDLKVLCTSLVNLAGQKHALDRRGGGANYAINPL